MEFYSLWAIQWFVCCVWGSVVAGQSNIVTSARYYQSIGRLCGWAACQGFCEQRDEILPISQYHDDTDKGCTTSKFNMNVQGARECDGAVCVTENTFQQGCQPHAVTRTACFSQYRNASTTRIHSRVCWDGSNCIDLVSFCRHQNSHLCTSFGTLTSPSPTFPKTSTSSPTPTDKTNPEKTSSKNTPVQPGTTFLYGSPTAGSIQGQPAAFVVGIVIGVCVAAMPIIIGAVILLIMRKKFNRKVQVRDSTHRSESIEMADGPVYASIGPEVPPKPLGSQSLGPSFLRLPLSSGITSSARSLHISGQAGSTLLGNLQRNKSLPALAYAVNSIPMESNDMLRAVKHTYERSRSTSSLQSPDSVADQTTSPHHNGSYRIPSTSPPMTSPSRGTGNFSPDMVNSRLIIAKNSGRGLTNKLYSEAVLPEPPSTYSIDSTTPHQYVNLRGSNDQLFPEHKTQNTTERKYAPIERGLRVNQKQDDVPTSGQYMGLESAGALTGPSAGQYMGLVECGPGDSGTVKPSDENNSVLSNNGVYTGLELGTNSQYMGLDEGTMSGSTTNDYMGLAVTNKPDDSKHFNIHTIPFTDGAYMGLEETNSKSQYMGIGDGSSECEKRPVGEGVTNPPLVSGSGAYSELNLLSREFQQRDAYMGLTPVEPNDITPRKDSGASASSYVDLDPNSEVSASISKKQNLHKTKNDERAALARRKYWKSKSTFQKRKPSEDGLNTTYEGLQPPQKAKKSFLFKSKRKGKPSGKVISEEAGRDLCLDLKISSPPPEETAKPHYFTLDVNSSTYGRCNGVGSVRESQQSRSNEEDKDAAFNLEGPFRPRSKSQPIQQTLSQYEEYEMIEDN